MFLIQYELKEANEKHRDKLMQYKLESIFMYAINLSKKENKELCRKFYFSGNFKL